MEKKDTNSNQSKTTKPVTLGNKLCLNLDFLLLSVNQTNANADICIVFRPSFRLLSLWFLSLFIEWPHTGAVTIKTFYCSQNNDNNHNNNKWEGKNNPTTIILHYKEILHVASFSSLVTVFKWYLFVEYE